MAELARRVAQPTARQGFAENSEVRTGCSQDWGTAFFDYVDVHSPDDDGDVDNTDHSSGASATRTSREHDYGK